MFLITLKQVGILFFYISIGYFCTRKEMFTNTANKILANLLTYIISPLYLFTNMSENFSLENISTYGILFLAGIVVVIIMLLISSPLSKAFSKDEYERKTYKYMFAFSNNGYFGFPLVSAVFGAQMLAKFVVFTMPAIITLNTYGYYLLTEDNSETEKSVKGIKWSSIFSPIVCGSLLGMICGILPLSLPQTVYDFLTPASNCYSPIAMILMGVVLGKYPFTSLFSSWKAYVFSVVRIILPFIFFGVLLLLKGVEQLTDIMLFAVIIASLPAGMNVVVFPESIGKDSSNSARSCFISYVLSILVIPLIFALINSVLGV